MDQMDYGAVLPPSLMIFLSSLQGQMKTEKPHSHQDVGPFQKCKSAKHDHVLSIC